MTSDEVPLAELCRIDRRHLRPSDQGASDLPFVGVEHVVAGNGTINLNSDSRVGNQKSTAFRFDRRHVLYGKLRPYLNKVATPDFAGKCSTELVPLLPRDGVNRDFLAHLLRRQDTVDFVMAAVTGSRMPRADMNVLLSMRVPRPPIEEQRRIVGILNRAAKVERLRDEASERLREFVPALFVKMFGDPVENAKGWATESLGELAERGPQNGLYRPKSQYGSGTRILRIDGFYGGKVKDATTWQRVRLDDRTLERYGLVEGDVVVNRVNSRPFLGKSALIPQLDEPAVFESNMMRLHVDEQRLRPDFLIWMLQLESVRALLCSNAKDAINQSSINQGDVKRLVVVVPPMELQSRFVEAVNSVSVAEGLGQESQRCASLLRAALVDQLLKGESQ